MPACSLSSKGVILFTMSTVKDIESAISKLSRNDLAELRAWFSEFDADAWDKRIEKDAHNGQLEAFYQSLQHENAGQPDVPLDEVLDEEKFS